MVSKLEVSVQVSTTDPIYLSIAIVDLSLHYIKLSFGSLIIRFRFNPSDATIQIIL